MSKLSKRERERARYIQINAPTYGPDSVADRWAAYEQLILDKYGDGSGDLDAACKSRDRVHRRAPHASPRHEGQVF
jgi:hypothetical protein